VPPALIELFYQNALYRDVNLGDSSKITRIYRGIQAVRRRLSRASDGASGIPQGVRDG
jgi:hypothetical protein